MLITRRSVLIALMGTPLASLPSASMAWAASAATSSTQTNWAADGTRARLLDEFPSFFGKAKGRYVDLRQDSSGAVKKSLLLDQYVHVFNGIPLDSIQIPNGMRVLRTAMPHNASQKSFTVTLGDSDTLVATALLHNFCGKYNGIAVTKAQEKDVCDASKTLSIFYPAGSTSNHELNSEIVQVVKKELRRNRLQLSKRTDLAMAPQTVKLQVRVL